LYPGEVPSPSLRSTSNEVGINLEVIIRDNGKVTTLCSMEIEHHTITTNKPRIITERAISITIRFPICKWIHIN
jgi:hypothetical protein